MTRVGNGPELMAGLVANFAVWVRFAYKKNWQVLSRLVNDREKRIVLSEVSDQYSIYAWASRSLSSISNF